MLEALEIFCGGTFFRLAMNHATPHGCQGFDRSVLPWGQVHPRSKAKGAQLPQERGIVVQQPT